MQEEKLATGTKTGMLLMRIQIGKPAKFNELNPSFS